MTSTTNEGARPSDRLSDRPSARVLRASVPPTCAAAVVALLALAGCGREIQTAKACESDAQCGDLQVCDVDTGTCLCTDDGACDGSEFCNSAGRCQAQAGCVSNDDCRRPDRPTDICDTQTGVCVTLNASTVQCLLDSHCPFGSFCENKRCVPGCRENGDCAIGQPCIDGTCDARQGACNDNGFCAYGELCDLSTNTCGPHRSQDQLCAACAPSFCFFDQDCPAGMPCNGGFCGGCNANECLIDPTVEPVSCTNDSQCAQPGSFCSDGRCSRYFCGNDACDDAGDPCPRGYNCYELTLVDPNASCTNDSQCPSGARCSAGGENNVAGFCSCLSDADCPQFSGASCINPGPFGYCRVGTTCGPASGLVCSDLL